MSYSQVGECGESEESVSVDNSDFISTQVSVWNHKAINSQSRHTALVFTAFSGSY